MVCSAADEGASLPHHLYGFIKGNGVDKLFPDVFIIIPDGGFTCHVIIIKSGVGARGNDHIEASFKCGFHGCVNAVVRLQADDHQALILLLLHVCFEIFVPEAAVDVLDEDFFSRFGLQQINDLKSFVACGQTAAGAGVMLDEDDFNSFFSGSDNEPNGAVYKGVKGLQVLIHKGFLHIDHQ